MPYIGYAFILLVCLEVILVCFDKVKPRMYPYLLYGTAAGMVLMTSLAGPYLIGSDIHLEYFYAQLRTGKDVIQPIVGIPQGTSILTYLTDYLWAYKLIYPLLFAGIPSIMYLIFRKWTSEKQAFLASFVFIAFPAFFMELPGIPRQMVAEVFLALLLYLLVVSRLRYRYKIPLVVICSALLPLLHYAVGIITLILLIVGCILGRRRRLVVIMSVVIIATGAVYFPMAEKGAVAIKLAHIYNSWVPKKVEVSAPKQFKPEFLSPVWAEHPPKAIPPTSLPFINRYEELIQRGLGLDFIQTTVPGKIFRILQWAFIILMGVGLWKLKGNKDYRAFMIGGIFLLLLLLAPSVSKLLNITRFLHLALFLLAPTLAVSLKPKYLLTILLPYFLFTSGFIFEATKHPNIEKVTIPYSVGLSSYRLDIGASLTEDDWAVRKYIHDKRLYPVASDIYGADFIGELVGWRDDLHTAFRREPMEVHNILVFVRSRNIKDGTFTVWNGVGRRKYVDPKEYYGIDFGKYIIYQKGEARVIWVP